MLTPQDAANEVLSCLQVMGQHQTNPVLEVIEQGKSFLENKQYPEDKLRFNNGVWRSYYHCHGEPYQIENEHGHFHIFHQAGNEQQWTHVAGLSMDSQGQPQHWFCTNRWVTNESWLPAEQTVQFLNEPLLISELHIVEHWLFAMLHLYKVELGELLTFRDQAITILTEKAPLAEVLDDRNYYMLSEKAIDLQGKLMEILVNEI